jgi:hypothetical protein
MGGGGGRDIDLDQRYLNHARVAELPSTKFGSKLDTKVLYENTSYIRSVYVGTDSTLPASCGAAREVVV